MTTQPTTATAQGWTLDGPITENVTKSYQVTLRWGGNRPEVLERRDCEDSIQALLAVCDFLDEPTYRFFDELNYDLPFVAIHQRELGEGYGKLTPCAFYQ